MSIERLNRPLLLVVTILAIALALAKADLSLAQDAYPELVNQVPASGTLVGNRAGSFAYYTIDYPGDYRVLTIELQFAPADPVTKLAFGFNVYGPNGYVIGHGAEQDEEAETPVQLQYSDGNEATWLVQVYNYLNNYPVSYSLVVNGLPESSPSPAPTPTAAPAVDVPAELDLQMAGALVGSRAGSFAFYELDYAGDGSEVALKMSFTPDDPIIARGVGLVVYGPSGEVAHGQPTGRPGERQLVFQSDEPGRYLIQVFNYIEGAVITYSIAR
jgi:hypothetical protein